jgi:hypothetical protein
MIINNPVQGLAPVVKTIELDKFNEIIADIEHLIENPESRTKEELEYILKKLKGK